MKHEVHIIFVGGVEHIQTHESGQLSVSTDNGSLIIHASGELLYLYKLRTISRFCVTSYN